ncbi:response regulator [Actibacterium sp. D379-3]
MELKQHIAIVEDEPEIRAMVAAMLEEEGYAVSPLSGGAELDRLLARANPDLVVLDLMLPGEDGLSICRRLTARGGPRILMLTARGSDIDRIVGLELGADDYLPKPFNPRELLARVRAVLRRGHAPAGPDRQIAEFAHWRLDFSARTLTERATGRHVDLSSGQFDLLAFFVQHPGRVLNRDQLLDGTRGRMTNPFDRAIDVQVSKLRRALGDDPGRPQVIKTVRGGGYMLSVPVQRGLA